jgi:phenylalanyl-tRNA synthetase beta chain
LVLVPIQIVCGAANVNAVRLWQQLVQYCMIKRNPLPLKGKIRGQESHGMICAEDELGLGQSHDGIMVRRSVNPGTAAADVFKIENDEVFEIGLLTVHAMSHLGTARV